MSELKELMQQEAVARLNILNLAPFCISAFEEGEIYKSENVELVSLDEDEKTLIKEFEEKTGFLVYHVMYNDMGMAGHQYAFFYVSNCADEWEDEKEDLKNKTPIVYAKNISNPDNSDFGSIGYKVQRGALMRMF